MSSRWRVRLRKPARPSSFVLLPLPAADRASLWVVFPSTYPEYVASGVSGSVFGPPPETKRAVALGPNQPPSLSPFPLTHTHTPPVLPSLGLCLDVRGYCSRRFRVQSVGHVFQVLIKLSDQTKSAAAFCGLLNCLWSGILSGVCAPRRIDASRPMRTGAPRAEFAFICAKAQRHTNLIL